MAEVIHDLDVLRPQPEYVKLGGKKIDISFVPSGVAMDVMARQQELTELANTPEKLEELQAGGETARRSFELSAELVASITESQIAEMTKEWLLKNTDVVQLKRLIELVTAAVMKSLDSVEDENEKKGSAAEEGNP